MFYTGKVSAENLYSELISIITSVQPGASSPWWTKESSLEGDGVFTSTGSNGDERIVLILREGLKGQYLIAGYSRDYTSGELNTTGAFDVPEVSNLYYFTTAQPVTSEVTYNLNITKDRIILNVKGDKLITQWANGLIYLGMPIRYDTSDRLCIVKVQNEYSPVSSRARLIQDSIGQTLHDYTWHFTASPGNPSWGGNVFLEVLGFGKTGEGLRGELDGLFSTHPDNMVDDQIVDHNGVDYLVIKRVSN